MSKRDPYFDVLKFVAIFMVVLGHVCNHTGLYCRFPALEGCIVGMNMPLFFLISGYFAEKNFDWSASKKIIKHLVGYFWPLAILAVAFSIPVLMRDGGLVAFCMKAGKLFLFTKWFLFVLLYCIVASHIVNGLSGNRTWCWYAAVTVIFIATFFCDHIWYVSSFRAMYLYFVFGMKVLPKRKIWTQRPVGVACAVIFLLVVVFAGDVHSNGLSFYEADTSATSIMSSWSVPMLMCARYGLGILGALGCMWIVDEMVNRFEWVRRLAPFGTTTLGVYLIHSRLISVFDFGGGVMATFFSALLIFAISHYIVYYTKRIRFVKTFLWGVGIIR